MDPAAPIYLDYNATTPLDPAVIEAMRPYLELHFGNPSSGHAYGRAALAGVVAARAQVAALLGCAPDEVVFTGGGSEADNQALIGVALAHRDRGDHLITTRIEHPAVLETCRYLERRLGFQVTYLPVDEQGQVDPAAVETAITPRTLLISVMHANNETGVLQPIAAIAALARRHGVLVHTDAAQSVGKLPVDVTALGVDLLAVAGHKLYAPKGVGVLYVRRGTTLDPFVHGAGHEGGRRAGTENVAGIVGLGAACAVARERLSADRPRLTRLRDRLEQALTAAGWVRNGHPTERLPNTLNASLIGAEGEAVLQRAPTVAASTGSACHSGHTEPSAVLLAMGLTRERALGAVRLSLGRWTTEPAVDRAAAALIAAGRAALDSHQVSAVSGQQTTPS
ncbi:MAG TPA: cysteine desulfurase family protein [Chloroflexota bacterium]|nr:cysteine desulfurase family protein [Chloroflexota bacterium]